MSFSDIKGGLRLKHSGRVTKEKLLEQIEIALTSVVTDYELETFSGVNVYINLFDKNGERLALLSRDGFISQGFDIANIKKDFSLSNIGCSLIPISELERRKEAKRQAQERIEAAHRAEFLMNQERTRQLNNKLNDLRAMLCKEFEVARISDAASSVAPIFDRKSILKYIDEQEIPSVGHVFRASLKDAETRKTQLIRIYDDNLKHIATYNKLTGQTARPN